MLALSGSGITFSSAQYFRYSTIFAPDTLAPILVVIIPDSKPVFAALF